MNFMAAKILVFIIIFYLVAINDLFLLNKRFEKQIRRIYNATFKNVFSVSSWGFQVH